MSEKNPQVIGEEVALHQLWAIKQKEILRWIGHSWANVNEWWGGFPVKFQVLRYCDTSKFFNLRAVNAYITL